MAKSKKRLQTNHPDKPISFRLGPLRKPLEKFSDDNKIPLLMTVRLVLEKFIRDNPELNKKSSTRNR